MCNKLYACCEILFPSMMQKQLENAAIANASQIEAARDTPVPVRFSYDAMPSMKSLNLSIAVL